MIRRNGFHSYVRAALALLALLAASAATAAPPTTTARVVDAEGRRLDGRLERLDPEAATLSTAGGRKTLPLGRIRRLDIRGSDAPALAERSHLRLVLTGGEVLLGTFAEAIEGGLVLASPDLGRVPLLLDVVRTIVPVPATADVCYEPEHTNPTVEDDVAYMHSGDHVSGIVLGVTSEGIEIETTARGRTRSVTWDDLLVAHLQNDPVDLHPDVAVEIETVEGARLRVAEAATFDPDAATLSFALRSVPERPLTMPVARVRTLRTQGGAFVYASDTPFESRFESYYGDGRPESTFLSGWFEARVDRRQTGCPLRLQGVTYRHGFAVHSRSSITLPLGGTWRAFACVFGVDDAALEVGAGGKVTARVRCDDRVVWEAKDVTAGEAPRKVGPLDVSSVDVLVLEVDFGADAYTADRATWADPILIRK